MSHVVLKKAAAVVEMSNLSSQPKNAVI